jgi:hypothetical protein
MPLSISTTRPPTTTWEMSHMKTKTFRPKMGHLKG